MEIAICGNLKEKISEFFVQTFSLLFFPGDNSFSQNKNKSGNVINISANKNTDNNIEISVNISYNKKIVHKSVQLFSSNDIVLDAGKIFYEAASELTGIYPPWGIHTGIRPAKAAGDILEKNNFDENKAVEILCGDYLMHKSKAILAVETYKNGKIAVLTPPAAIISQTKLAAPPSKREALERIDFSLYISIPFCPTRCKYCSFVSFSTPRLLKLIPEYVKKLVEEIELTGKSARGMRLKSIYIGGGTPTTLNCEYLEIILNAVKNNFNLANIVEYTVECGRADTITKQKLELLKSFEVDRISINPQTLNDDILKQIGRCHTSGDFFRAFELARSVGIKNINTDCIIGLTDEPAESMIDTIKTLADLRPENITIHTLCIKKSAELKSEKHEIIYTPNAPELNNVLETGYNILKSADYKPYYMYRQKYVAGNLENTGFCLDGRECLYNIYMMDEIQTIFGVGAGAMTKLVKDGRIERIANYKYPYEYIEHDFQINRDINKEKLKLLGIDL